MTGQFGRRTLVSRTNPEKWLVRGRCAVAVKRPGGVLETLESGGPKHRYLAMADAAAFKQRRFIAVTASNRASAGSRRHVGRHCQTPGTSL